MILVLCTECALGVRIIGEAAEVDSLVGESSDFWPDKFPCPECEKPAQGFFEVDVDARIGLAARIVDLTPSEAFAAFHGLGLPTELNCTIGTLNELVSKHAVKRFVGRNILGTTRCTLAHIELEDGSKIYLGAGAAGACVYRIVRPHSYVENVDGR